MITPSIAPRRIMGNAAAGLFSAAKSSIRKMESVTNTISKSPSVTKEEKLGINYVQFFGSKKNSKILKKSLKTIRDSLVATFAIAKLLRSEVSKSAKLVKDSKKGGFFGGLLKMGGGIIGAAGTVLSLLKLLANPIVLKILGITALVGGTFTLAGFLYANRDSIKEFIMNKAQGLYDFLMNFVSNVVSDFLGDRVKSPALRNVEIESEENIAKSKEEFEKEGLSPNEAQFQAVQNEIINLSEQILTLQNKEGRSTKENNKLKALRIRKTELETGKVTTDVLSKNFLGISNPTEYLFGNRIRKALRKEPILPVEEYSSKSNVEKLETIRALAAKFQRQGNSLDTIKQVYMRALLENKVFKDDGTTKKLTEDQRIFAMDMVNLADQIQASGNKSIDLETFKPANINTKIPGSMNISSDTGSSSFVDTNLGNVSGVSTPILNQGADIFSQPTTANSAPSFSDIVNFNPDNDFIEYNASLLNIFP